MKVIFWTDERIDALLRLWAEGNSATRIGAQFGVSRCAVLGKLHRLRVPRPVLKKAIARDRTYVRQLPEITKANAAARQKRYQTKKRLETQKEFRAQFRLNGTSPTSAAYRKHLPPLPEMTKGELRAMLAQAVANTVAL